MDDIQALLYAVFDDLRRQGVPLGIPEYLAALGAVRGGVGWRDTAGVARVCRLIWAKSREDQIRFDGAFTRHLREQDEERVSRARGSANKLRSVEQARGPRPTPQPAPAPVIEAEKVAPPQPTGQALTLPGAPPPALSLDEAIERARPAASGFHFAPRLPLSRREMASIWRRWRRLQREGPPEVLDVDGTIEAITRTGAFLRPVLQPRRRNQARLVLLIDHGGSMAPLSLVVDALIDSIDRGGLLGQAPRYYFHNYPEETVWERPELTGSHSFEAVLAAHARDSSVLFISDAGAARGAFSGARLRATRAALATVRDYTYRYAWLNPLPRRRWRGATAEALRAFVPMFSLDRDGLIDTVNVLRGHPFPAGVSLDER